MIHVPSRFAGYLDRDAIGDEPIVAVLDRQGVQAERAEQAITAVAATGPMSDVLGLAPGSPLICMRRLMTTDSAEPILHQESFYAPDLFEYRMTLSRAKVGPSGRWTPIG